MIYNFQVKKSIILILFLGIYLNRSYAHFYNFSGQKHLVPPQHPVETIIGNLAEKTLKYAALGDSLTAGVGVSDYKNSYPFLIAQKLSSKNNVMLINLAHEGDTSADMLLKLPTVISQNPDLITILIGINDIHNFISPMKFEENLIQAVKTLKTTNAKIYLLSLPYLGSSKILYFPYNFILDFQTQQFNNIIRKTAKDVGLEFIDLYTLEKSVDFYSKDQFHPSQSGYKSWSEAINVN